MSEKVKFFDNTPKHLLFYDVNECPFSEEIIKAEINRVEKFLGDYHAEINPLLLTVLKLLNKRGDKVINSIDIGCAIGDCNFRMEYLKHKENYNFTINSIGIDPLLSEYKTRNIYGYNQAKVFKHGLKLYNNLIECAISSEEGEQDFYIQKSLDCSSLNKINESKIANQATSNDNFYLPKRIKNIVTETEKIVKIPVKKLSTIIEEQNLANELIHFLKVDAQGQDLNVIKSCEKYLKNVAIVMIETTMPYIEKGTLYQNSTNFKEDTAFFEKNNFKLLKFQQLLHDDADALFYNTSLITPED